MTIATGVKAATPSGEIDVGRLAANLDNLQCAFGGIGQAFEVDATFYNACKAYILRCVSGQCKPIDWKNGEESKLVSVEIDTYTKAKADVDAEKAAGEPKGLEPE